MIEFRSKKVEVPDQQWDGNDKITDICNEWALEGWEVFSVIVPQGSNYNTYRLTAKRQVKTPRNTGRKFR